MAFLPNFRSSFRHCWQSSFIFFHSHHVAYNNLFAETE